ncbi:MAG: cryptochrome/photolyase family protein [Candidatus Nanopelagicales bacterium]
MATIHWFRRDLRLSDNPSLLAAIAEAEASSDPRVVPLFILDPDQFAQLGAVRGAYLVRSLNELGKSLDRNLLIRHGKPEKVLTEVIAATKATSVHLAADYEPAILAQDLKFEKQLSIPFVRTGSPYAVAPTRVTKDDGTPYRVFTPFYKAWLNHGWRKPAPRPTFTNWWMSLPCEGRPAEPDIGELTLPTAGESAALARWETFRSTTLTNYAEDRNRADLVTGTSKMSVPLRFGEIHPRTILADLTAKDEVYQKEICWREFYADVLHHNPHTISENLNKQYDLMPWETGKVADENFTAWCYGKTGFPFVDAGMRQLLAEGWMHNRVRMVVASFLVKDLHIDWRRGANWFMQWLADGDIASNQHGWQWTAGSGTDASPFYRVFNPITQGLKFDPNGDYIRRYIPELSHLPGELAHEPWKAIDGYQHGYPEAIVDHAVERVRALADYEKIKKN